MFDLKTKLQLAIKTIKEVKQEDFERPQLHLPSEDIYYVTNEVKKKEEPKRVIEIEL
jgi:hypothetical protein